MQALLRKLIEVTELTQSRLVIEDNLRYLFMLVGAQRPDALSLTEDILDRIRRRGSLADIEKDIINELRKTPVRKNLLDNILNSYKGRADYLYGLVSKWIIGQTVLDLGGGSGYVAKKIKEDLGKKVAIADVVNYNCTDLPFINFDGYILPVADKVFSTVLMLTVLHHAERPDLLLHEARRVGNRLIIIETVFGGNTQGEIKTSLASTIFFDWFTNRIILGLPIDVPYNFNSINIWKKLFIDNKFRIVCSQDLGHDQKTIFLKHHLFVLDS